MPILTVGAGSLEVNALELSEQIETIKQNADARSDFIMQYKPFIASFTAECVKHYVKYGVDEELSIALLAFDEAIERFNGKGNFLLYAKMVIRSRLLDYFKTTTYREQQNSYGLYNEEDEEIDALKSSAIENYQVSYENSIRVMEIQELNKQLQVYGISFYDLVKTSPKHVILRKFINSVIRQILDNEELTMKVLNDHVLPLKEIEKNFLIPRKKIEKHRKYIIAVIVIVHSEFDSLKEYLPF